MQEYNGAVWLYRQVKPLRPTEVDKLWAFAVGHAGVDYDAIGAFRARGAGFGWLDRLLLRRKEDLTSIFCSEFVAAALRHVGLFHTANASRWSPNKLGRALLAGGKYGKPIRLK
ncbi:MAG: hypothetical protein GY835_24595 [bacterium]|nr:hypothetical protein [bacterium]